MNRFCKTVELLIAYVEYNILFSEDEKKMICEYECVPGVKDHLYLLSVSESKKYIKEVSDIFLTDTKCMWTRDDGKSIDEAMVVDVYFDRQEYASTAKNKRQYNFFEIETHPVMWINIGD